MSPCSRQHKFKSHFPHQTYIKAAQCNKLWANGTESSSAGRQEVLDRAVSLAQEGEDLIQKSHYAQDSIQPKCTEISTISEDVRANLRARRDQLLKAMKLHHALERVRAEPALQLWCDTFVIVKVLLLFPGFQMGGWWDLPAGVSTSRQVFISRGSRISPPGAGGLPE